MFNVIKQTFAALILLVAPLLGLLLAGCGGDSDGTPPAREIVLYTSVDEPVARPIIEAFEQETGHSVKLVTDTEATKSVGLAERLRAEARRPRADVWWGNEPFLTVALADEGLLASYAPPSAADVWPQFKDAQSRWTGNGLRARVLVVGPNVAATSIASLADSSFEDKVVLARPTAGTTASHVAALYVLWGRDKFDDFFRNLHENGAVLVPGNSVVAKQVGEGNYWLGLTDNDDVSNAKSAGLDATAILPDQAEGQIGTLALPTTVALVAGRPESAAAKQLVDYLASPEVEQKLIAANFVAYGVRDAAAIRAMDVDYAAVAAALPEATRRATAILEGRRP